MLTIPQFFLNTPGISPESGGIAVAMATKMGIGKLLPITQINNLTFSYSKTADEGEVVRRTVNRNFPDARGATMTPETVPITIYGRSSKVDVRLTKINERARASMHAQTATAIGLAVDDAIFNSRRSQTSDDIDGLAALCTGSQNIIAGGMGGNGATLTLDHIHDLIDAVDDVGAGRDLYIPNPLLRSVKDLVVEKAGGASIAEISQGLFQYEGVRFRPINKGLDGLPILDFTETQGSDNQTASIYCVAPGASDVEMSGVRVLVASNSIEVIENGTEGSFIVDVIEFAFGLVVFEKTSAARLSGVKKPA
jgi:hypothetical protein